jgi:hypothetical protein
VRLVQGGKPVTKPPDEQPMDLAGLAAVVNSRLAADARVARALSFAWFFAGAGVATLLGGLGLAAALLGYSHLISIESAAGQSAKALAAALQNAQVKTSVSGTMALAPATELKLASRQTVKLAEGATVRLDPSSTIRVVGDVKMPQPSPRQLQAEIRVNDQLPFTSYTIFRSVLFGAGRVDTGWDFDLSDTTRPRAQHCSYIQSVTRGAQVKDVIAANGVARQPPSKVRTLYDFEGATRNCIWFSGM